MAMIMPEVGEFGEMLQKHIRERLAAVAAEEGEKAAEAVRKRVAGEVDKIALSLASNYEVWRDATCIRITVKKEI